MHLLLLNYEADNFGRKKSRRKIKSLTDFLSQSYDNSLREEENLNLEGLWVYKFMFFPQLTQWAKVRLILPLNRQIARVGRRSLSPHSANCKLQVNRLWQDFPSAQDKFHSASFHCTGTGRKQSKYRHQRAVFTPTGAPRKLRRGPMAPGISILPLWMCHAGTFQKFMVWKYISLKTPMVLGESCVLPPCQLPCRVSEVSGLLCA